MSRSHQFAGVLLVAAALLVLGCKSEPEPDPPEPCLGCTVIRNVRILDADGVRDSMRVVISAERIVSVVPDDGPVPQAGAEIDGTGRTLVPGLWDLHVHSAGAADLGTITNYTPENLRSLLYNGVTGILDVGSFERTIFSARDRVAAAELRAPRLKVVGKLVSVPGGHPCVNTYSDAFCSMVTGPATAASVIDDLMEHEPDLIKIVIESGGFDPFPPLPRMTSAEIVALVDAANTRGIRLIAHVSATVDAEDALTAGVHSLAHMPVEEPLPAALVADYAAAGVPVVSTIAAYEAYDHYLEDPQYVDAPHVVASVPAEILDGLRDPTLLASIQAPAAQPFIDRMHGWAVNAMQNVVLMHDAGVPILLGTDAGNFLVFHGPAVHRELDLMVRAGLTAVEAITTATLEPARFFGQDDELGRVAEGYIADLVLVNGDPSKKMTDISNIEEVWLAGERLDRDTLHADGPVRDGLLLKSRDLSSGEFCLDDEECSPGTGCEPFDRLCTQTCAIAAPSTCPTDFACFGFFGLAPFCYPSSGCDVLGQDCPYDDVYLTTCTPVEADYTWCPTSGSVPAGGSCPFADPDLECEQGLYCGLGELCFVLCDPAGVSTELQSCLPGETCTDLSGLWGHPVGLCQ